jgi:hypothetical protein
MGWITQAKINCAIKDCLNRCYDSKNPVITVGNFVAELRSDPLWRAREADLVELNVLRILRALMARKQPQ